MKFLKLFFCVVFIISSIFLYINYKKTTDEKSYVYLKIRSTVISKIEFLKNTNLFKHILYLRGKNYIEDNFTDEIFKEKINILINEYILDKEEVFISQITLNYLKNELATNLNKVKDKETSYYKRLDETVKFNLSEPEKDFNIFKVEFENIRNYGILERSNKKKLIIFNQGHLGNSYNKKYFLEVKRYFKDNGFDFLTLNMLGRGFNFQGNVKFPNKSKNIQLNTYDHENIQYFLNKKYQIKKPLSLFLSGNYYLINHIINKNNYDEIIFFGVSAGGWYGLFLSPLIKEIDVTYVFNGNVPKYLMNFKDTKGDWEVAESEVYDRINYWTLYKMIYKNPENQKKKLYMIYNTKDKCCFRDPSASVMKKIEKKINNNRFNVKLYEREKFHGVDLNFLIKIFD